MDKQTMNVRKFMVFGGVFVMLLALAIVLPVLAQQQSQQKQSNSTLTGTVKGASMTLDKNCKWNVTGDSFLTSLNNTTGISGTKITNIIGNGHTVFYDKELSDNKTLGGKTYTLASGGKLSPNK